YLVRIRQRGVKPSWLLFKAVDGESRQEAEGDITEDRPESVLSGATVSEPQQSQHPTHHVYRTAHRPRKKEPSAQNSHSAANASAEIKLSHPDKRLFPPEGPTKQELADYYAQVASRMWPYVKDRPLALLRCPQGAKKECFFQKHIAAKHAESGLAPVAIREKG